MNPNSVYVHRRASPARPFRCSHCNESFPASYGASIYTEHVKLCVARAIVDWDADAYSKKYYAQVRAISRFSSITNPNRRNQYRSWGWWLVKPDGPVLMNAEVSSAFE